MTLKISKPTVVILTVVAIGFGAFFLFVSRTVPGEKEILAKIAKLETQPQPSSCPHPLEREGLFAEVTRIALVYKAHKRYEQATPFFIRAIEMQKKLCGVDYPGLMGPMLLLAENYELSGHPEQAEPIRREVQMRKEQLNDQNPEQPNIVL